MNKMLRTIHLSVLMYLGIVIPGHSQDQFMIKGSVIDAQTNEPLAFSTISILGTSNGVVSNFLGAFEFSFHSLHEQDTLYVSMLGYEPYKVAIHELKTAKELTIRLNESILLLDEVEVNEQKLSALDIVKNVIANIPKNYPNAPYLLDGFTR